MRTQKQLLVLQTITGAVFGVHYWLVGATAGMALNFIVILRNISYYYRNQKGRRDIIMPIVFAVIMGIAGVITWDAWYSVFSVLGLIISTLCMAFSDPQKVRKSILITSPMVLVYNAFSLSMGSIVYESIAVISSVIGLVRMRKRQKHLKMNTYKPINLYEAFAFINIMLGKYSGRYKLCAL